jgi:hypothetical protein
MVKMLPADKSRLTDRPKREAGFEAVGPAKCPGRFMPAKSLSPVVNVTRGVDAIERAEQGVIE